MAILAECPQCHKKQTVRNKVCTCGKELDRAKRAQKIRYWINYVVPGTGKQRREAVGFSIEEARTAEGKRKVQKYENPRILEKAPDERMTFRQLTDWYIGLEKVKAKKHFKTLQINLKNFNSEFGDMIVARLKPIDLENYQVKRKTAGYSDAYVDYEIGAARAMVNKAFDNDMVSGDTLKTFKRVEKLLKANANARDRILSPDEFERLLAHLPDMFKAVVATGYYTGMREQEILSLTRDKLFLEERFIKLEAEDTKDREPRLVPICEELYAILKNLPRSLHDNRVFLFNSTAPKQVLWKILAEACKKAGIIYGRFEKGGFIFHDLRHTFNTNMRKAGVPQSVIMKITGHSTDQMFRRYDTIDAEDASNAVDQMSNFLRKIDQSLD